MSHLVPGAPLLSERFRFRFVVRGDQAMTMAALAIGSLLRCHPRAQVVIVDANDHPALSREMFGADGDIAIVHVRPQDDPVAQVTGRGSRPHLFYWRHSPQLRSALPPATAYDAYSDCDIIYLRPLDLKSLTGPLSRGRIAATVDESSIDYYLSLGSPRSEPVTSMLPSAGSGGPLLQGGLLFTNPDDDGGIYDRFWSFATNMASAGHLAKLPWDDMCILTTLLGQGGPLWERLLPLSHDWDYISDSRKDPGIFGRAAHYGGHRAKNFLLSRSQQILPPTREPQECWGAVAVPENGTSAYFISREPPGSNGPVGPLRVPLPFCLSWLVPEDATSFTVSATISGPGDCSRSVSFIVYVDGHLSFRFPHRNQGIHQTLPLTRAETITIVGIAQTAGCTALLESLFAASHPARSSHVQPGKACPDTPLPQAR
jgi:hypothetical protein